MMMEDLIQTYKKHCRGTGGLEVGPEVEGVVGEGGIDEVGAAK